MLILHTSSGHSPLSVNIMSVDLQTIFNPNGIHRAPLALDNIEPQLSAGWVMEYLFLLFVLLFSIQ